MNKEDYIRKGVEMAEGWHFEKKYEPFASVLWGPDHLQGPVTSNGIKDALAAQLVRQVDALDSCFICVWPDRAVLEHKKRNIDHSVGEDRTMNTIKAIVDSGVLK